MRFEKILPIDSLKPYIKYLVISESSEAQTYKVFPSTGLVIGFQYQGNLAYIQENAENPLAKSGITGLQDSFRTFKNSVNIGTILVVFNEIGASHFFQNPMHELYAESLSLDNFIKKSALENIEEQLAEAKQDLQRIQIVETFLLSQLIEKQEDKLISQAVKYIYQAKGNVKIKQLNEFLAISQSPFEKRFRKIVGASPKKFASIVRFNSVLETLEQGTALTKIAYENNYFDQAHFIHDFKLFTGESPEKFMKTYSK